MEIAAGILPLYTRTPSLLAMTAAGVDALSDGRCILGLGASGPQVIEGFHGVRYDKPLARTREIVDICRTVWKREEKLTHAGPLYPLPLPEEQGSGLGTPLKLINHPVRPAIPIYVGGMGARGHNYYNTLVQRYGFEAEAKVIQDLYLDGKKKEAEAAVPQELLELTSLIGPEGYIKERLAAYKESGVTLLSIAPLGGDQVGTVAKRALKMFNGSFKTIARVANRLEKASELPARNGSAPRKATSSRRSPRRTTVRRSAAA